MTPTHITTDASASTALETQLGSPTQLPLSSMRIQFDLPIRFDEIPYFRGAINARLKYTNDLFHNHNKGGGGVKYRYPLIQYKEIDQKATLFCIGEEGIQACRDISKHLEGNIRLGGTRHTIMVEEVIIEEVHQLFDGKKHIYRLTNWVPLNSANHTKYSKYTSLIERIQLLQSILIGNILSALRGLNIFVKEVIRVEIVDFERAEKSKYKGIDFLIFDIRFGSNIRLPNYIGLGKHTSVGYGTAHHLRAIQLSTTEKEHGNSTQ